MRQFGRFRAMTGAVVALGLAVGTAGQAFAAPATRQSANFSVSIRGLTAATLSLDGRKDESSYDATGTLASAGLLGWIRHIRYDASVRGRFAGGRAIPSRYVEKADTGKRQSEAVMAYRGGVPQVKSYSPPRPPMVQEVDPLTQGGTVDPLTALFLVLRDVPVAQACALRLTLFDGRRRSAVVLGPPERTGEQITCAGEYRRLKGFTAADLAEKSRFPFRLTYSPAGPGLVRVTEITMDTLYGQGRMIRR